MSAESFWGWFFSIIGTAIITFFVGLGMVGIAGSVRSDGTAKYCYVQQREGRYWVIAVRPWTSDRWLAPFPTSDEAVRFTSQIGCPIK